MNQIFQGNTVLGGKTERESMSGINSSFCLAVNKGLNEKTPNAVCQRLFIQNQLESSDPRYFAGSDS